VLIFGFFGVMHAKNHAKGTLVANVIVGMMAAALIASSVLRLLPTSQLEWVNRESFLALYLGQAHFWLLGLLPVVALVLGFMKSEKSHA
jgi:hypothetical protein